MAPCKNRRTFRLPDMQELTDEQVEACHLPKEGRHLIIGGPGTGKSVIALLRCKQHIRDRDNYVFLVYNHMLRHASHQLFAGMNLKGAQWQSWFEKTFHCLTGKPVRKLPPDHNNFRHIDWDHTLDVICSIAEPPSGAELPYLIIDEGQDMPPQFYKALDYLGFDNFFVVADQNQQITSGLNSSRKDIEDILDIATGDVIELTQNCRNPFSIARLARSFYTGDPASPPPQLPANKNPDIRPVLIEYSRDAFTEITRGIVARAVRNRHKLIGIITPDSEVRDKYFIALQSVLKLENGPPRLMTYRTRADLGRLFFNRGGIIVANAQACKGLEFDTVFMADINRFHYWEDISDQVKKLFYVIISRARDTVVILKEKDKKCPVDKIMPDDTNVLERRQQWQVHS